MFLRSHAMQNKEELKALGIDIDAALERFMGSEKLILKTLTLFTADENLNSLCTALENNNAEEAYKAAHTLKGVCGNLSLTKLFELIKDISDALAKGDAAAAKSLLPAYAEEHKKVVEGIKKWI